MRCLSTIGHAGLLDLQPREALSCILRFRSTHHAPWHRARYARALAVFSSPSLADVEQVFLRHVRGQQQQQQQEDPLAVTQQVEAQSGLIEDLASAAAEAGTSVYTSTYEEFTSWVDNSLDMYRVGGQGAEGGAYCDRGARGRACWRRQTLRLAVQAPGPPVRLTMLHSTSAWLYATPAGGSHRWGDI